MSNLGAASGMIAAVFRVWLRTLVRCGVFVLIGPAAGLVTFIVLGRGSPDLSSDDLTIVVLFVYLLGLVPACLAAVFDEFLDRHRTKSIPKYLVTGAFGYAAAYVLPLMPLLLYQPRWGLIGAIPAAICSWINEIIIIGISRSSARIAPRPEPI